MTGIDSLRLRHPVWFALMDAEACRLCCCGLTRQGTHHVDVVDTLANTIPEQEHNRPATMGGMTHHVEDNEHRFAGQIVNWLQSQATRHKFSHLAIFSPPRMLGALREIPLGSLNGRVVEIKGDLMRLNAGQLADHALIHDLFKSKGPNDKPEDRYVESIAPRRSDNERAVPFDHRPKTL